MMRVVMHPFMPDFIVHYDGFAMGCGNSVARFDGLNARLQIGHLLMLLCGGGHQLCGR